MGGAGGDSGKSEAYSRETLPEAGSSLGRSGGRDTEGHGAEEAMIMDPHSLAKSGADRREVESCLRKALRDLDPQRRKVRSLDGSRRVPIARASAAELAAAVAALQDCKRKIDSEGAPQLLIARRSPADTQNFTQLLHIGVLSELCVVAARWQRRSQLERLICVQHTTRQLSK